MPERTSGRDHHEILDRPSDLAPLQAISEEKTAPAWDHFKPTWKVPGLGLGHFRLSEEPPGGSGSNNVKVTFRSCAGWDCSQYRVMQDSRTRNRVAEWTSGCDHHEM